MTNDLELIDIFKTLVKIPSPSMKEGAVADKIIEILDGAGISAGKDSYGNVYAGIDWPLNSENLLLSAHMDVVGDDREVKIVEKEGFIETDKTRTLGADDKAGVAAIIKLFLDVKSGKINAPCGLEAVFTRDEENSMTGIENVEFNRLNADYVLVLDSDKLGNVEVAGSGYLKLTINVKTPFGGHSGLDIADVNRLNAVKLLVEIVSKIPQGVYKFDEETGVSGVKTPLTSINLGSIIGGGVENAVYQAVHEGLRGESVLESISKGSMSNIINTSAYAHYSLRSSDIKTQEELIAQIQDIINEFNIRYGEIDDEDFKSPCLAVAKLEIEEHLPVFEKSDDKKLIKTAEKAGIASNVPVRISSFHAGAETHIYANRKNAHGRVFKPVLLGVADVYNMHSVDEKIDIASYLKGYTFLKAFVEEFSADAE